MAFDEVRFPVGISKGAVGGPGHDTAVVGLPITGAEERASRRDGAKRFYDATMEVKSTEAVAEVMSFVLARAGSARGFRWKDFHDFTSASDHRSTHNFDDQVIGAGDGITTEFQLRKVYSDGLRQVVRLIEKPVLGTVRIALDGSEAMSGWTVNTTDGIVTFTSPPSVGVEITAGFEFDVPVRFDDSIDKWMRFRIMDASNNSVPQILVQELLNEEPVDDEFFYGGGTAWTPMTGDITITTLNGRSITVSPNAAGLKLQLPDPTNLALGGPRFFLINLSATDTVAIRDEGGGPVATLGTKSTLIAVLAWDGAAKFWICL